MSVFTADAPWTFETVDAELEGIQATLKRLIDEAPFKMRNHVMLGHLEHVLSGVQLARFECEESFGLPVD